MAARAEGRLYDADVARDRACVAELEGETVAFRDRDGALLARTPRDALRVEPPVGGLPRRVTLPDDRLFEGRGDVDAWPPRRPRVWLRRLERWGPHLAAVAAAGAILVWLAYAYALPVAVRVAIWLTPPSAVQALDASVLETLETAALRPSTLPQARRDALQADFAALVAALEAPPRGRRLRLLIRDAPRFGPNALALPGGTVVLTDQLVRLTADAEAVAAVMAHEIGHVAADHSLSRLYRAVGVAGGVALVAGDAGPLLETVLFEGATLLALAHSRAHEREADAFAASLMRRAGRDPAAIARFFEALQDQVGPDSGPAWLSTHPGLAERIRAARDTIR